MSPSQIIVLATPVFLLLIAIELAVGWRRQRNTYRLADAVSSISLGMLSQTSAAFTHLLRIGIYTALFVKTQVISVRDTHAVCDAGHKSHAIDSGPPTVAHLPADRALRYANGGDEHGILYAEGDKARLPALGRMLWLVPGHCDPTVNLHDFMIGVRGGLAQGVVERIIRVDARGALT